MVFSNADTYANGGTYANADTYAITILRRPDQYHYWRRLFRLLSVHEH